MKKIYITICLCLFTLLNFAGANDTRMGTLMAGDYIDDLINITVYPHQIGLYHNNLWGDITENNVEDYGIIITPDIKYGALAIWEPGLSDARFNIGYGISIFNFDVGAFVSPVEEHTQFGFGLGRSFFTRRFDLSFIVNDEVGIEWYQFNLRLSKRKTEFIIVPKYKLDYHREPYEYTNHRIGLMLQRLILNEGFVFFIAEYDFSRGDIQSKYTKFYVGLELPLNRIFIMRLGVSEVFTDGFENPQWFVEPGIGLKIREFSLDFHLNKDRLFDKDVTIVNSFGLDLNFGRF
jgi:hypothetical protein